MLQITTVHLTKHIYLLQNYGSSQLTQHGCFSSKTNTCTNSKFNLKESRFSEYYGQIYIHVYNTQIDTGLNRHNSDLRSWSQP